MPHEKTYQTSKTGQTDKAHETGEALLIMIQIDKRTFIDLDQIIWAKYSKDGQLTLKTTLNYSLHVGKAFTASAARALGCVLPEPVAAPADPAGDAYRGPPRGGRSGMTTILSMIPATSPGN